jgi:hypothetical protein
MSACVQTDVHTVDKIETDFINKKRSQRKDTVRTDWKRVEIFYSMPVCGLVVRVPGYRSRGPGSILGATRVSE